MQASQCSQYEWWSCRWLSAAAIRKVGERRRRHTERDALKKKPNKKQQKKKQKRAHMAFGVCGMVFNPQCQVKEQVPNCGAEVHQLTNFGWACVGEDAQSLRLCEVGLPVSFYFKPTDELFFFFFASLKEQTRKQFFFTLMKLHTHWCWIGSQSLKIFQHYFFFCK